MENDPTWAERVRAVASHLPADRIEIRLAPFDLDDTAGFLESDYLLSMPAEPADIVVVDCAEDWPRHVLRPSCFARAQLQVKRGGIIVVDDSWRYPEILEQSRALSRVRFQSTGPARFGVTSTDIHFY